MVIDVGKEYKNHGLFFSPDDGGSGFFRNVGARRQIPEDNILLNISMSIN
jgi:hypothetical protein